MEAPRLRALSWLQSFGLKVEYVEPYEEDAAGFVSSLEQAGVLYTDRVPSTATAIEYVRRGNAVMAKMAFGLDDLTDFWGRYPNLISVQREE